MKEYIFAPSLLAANFMKLTEELDKCVDNGVEWIHYDVMDFHFVPNLTFGSKILQEIAKNYKNLKLDIHFMVDIVCDYETFFAGFLAAKPQMLTMHVESLKTKKQIEKFIRFCHQHGVKASLAISPKTSVNKILRYLPDVDNVLVMSVEPGFGGQEFMEEAVPKIVELNNFRTHNDLNYTIEVDGGINDKTVKQVKEAGVDMIVAGSYFFKARNPKSAVAKLIK